MKKERFNRYLITGKLKTATISFSALSLVWLLMLLALSLFEIIYNGVVHEFPPRLASIILLSCLGDMFFLFSYLLKIYLIFVILFFIRPLLAKLLYKITIVLMLIIQLLLIMYFSKTLLPLGADMYGYSIADIKQTIGASGVINWEVIVIFLIFIGVIIVGLQFFSDKIKLSFTAAIILPALAFLTLFINLTTLIQGNLGSDFANNLIINKSCFFYAASLKHFYPEDNEVDIYADSYIGDYGGQQHIASSFNYIDPAAYPFLHTDSTKDVLSPFFKCATAPPNIVIILVEGLGRAFTNQGAYLGNFTPFMDSLSNKSLYWRNFLSNGGRTFAVLPSLLGSLPFAKNGFLEMGEQMPAHLSLLSLLKYNGYYTSFYYGGDAHFDNMDIFLRKNQTDQINGGSSFPPGYQKLPAIDGFTWGYNDKELFRYYLNSTAPEQVKSPQLNVILTISTHDPFRINEEDNYLKAFESRMTTLGFDETKKSKYRNYKYQYASILYTDDALRGFFATYRKRSDYNNTIFLITGDHRMPEIPMSDKIDRYHVPLIIYSPLLKRTSQMSSVSSHFDISPSILAYLKHNYKIQTPGLASWMGQGLDTNVNFQNIHQYPLMQTKTDILDFVMGEYHLNGDLLFKLADDMSEAPVNDAGKHDELKNAFNQFTKRNAQFINNAKLVPDSMIQHYKPAK